MLCFGSLGNVTKGYGSIVRKICRDRSKAKNVLKWCLISNIIGANYIWRNRVKKLLVRWNNNSLFFFQFASLNVASWHQFACMNSCFSLKFETSKTSLECFSSLLQCSILRLIFKHWNQSFFFRIRFSFGNHFRRMDFVLTLVSKSAISLSALVCLKQLKLFVLVWICLELKFSWI